MEGYLFSLQGQEINTRTAQKRWEKILIKDAILTVDVDCASKKMKTYSTLYRPVLHFQLVSTCIIDMTKLERSYMKK